MIVISVRRGDDSDDGDKILPSSTHTHDHILFITHTYTYIDAYHIPSTPICELPYSYMQTSPLGTFTFPLPIKMEALLSLCIRDDT